MHVFPANIPLIATDKFEFPAKHCCFRTSVGYIRLGSPGGSNLILIPSAADGGGGGGGGGGATGAVTFQSSFFKGLVSLHF